jgi:UDP-glucuronate 4-epimerase
MAAGRKGPVLVTGGAGFIGSHLVERLLAEGRHVRVLDNLNDAYDPRRKEANLAALRSRPGFEFVRADLRDPAALHGLVAGRRPAAVVHIAALAGVRPSLRDPVLYHDVNVAGTLTLLEALRATGPVPFVFASSSSVYGRGPKLPFREDAGGESPIAPYGATKLAGEQLCHSWHRLTGAPVACLRFFTVYGPRQRPDLALFKFTRRILQDREIDLYGDGTSTRDYTYVDDIVEGTLRALERCEGFRVYNLGGGRSTTLRELLELLERSLGRTARVRQLAPVAGDMEATLADVSRAAAELGYRPAVPPAEGVPRFVRWFLSEPLAREGSDGDA